MTTGTSSIFLPRVLTQAQRFGAKMGEREQLTRYIVACAKMKKTRKVKYREWIIGFDNWCSGLYNRENRDIMRGTLKMISESVTISERDMKALLGAASPDAALLFLYVLGGNDPAAAGRNLHISETRISCAEATLRQLGMWPEERVCHIAPGERPAYSERDVLQAMDGDSSFRSLYGEVQRRLGRSLNTEELKILLGFVRYLGLPGEVISVLISYCQERARRKGSTRNPSLRTIEKEAYAWAERGIDTMEEAAAFIQVQNVRNSRISQLMNVLQIHGRSLTAAEERYAQGWLDMGFDENTVAMAYERTCLNTGGMNWAYMDKIMQRWHQQGLHSVEEIHSGDRKNIPKGASGKLGAAELEAIQKVLQEE